MASVTSYENVLFEQWMRYKLMAIYGHRDNLLNNMRNSCCELAVSMQLWVTNETQIRSVAEYSNSFYLEVIFLICCFLLPVSHFFLKYGEKQRKNDNGERKF